MTLSATHTHAEISVLAKTLFDLESKGWSS